MWLQVGYSWGNGLACGAEISQVLLEVVKVWGLLAFQRLLDQARYVA
jgi:hypothetical protein